MTHLKTFDVFVSDKCVSCRSWQAARSWQALEVALFALRCIAPTIKLRCLPANGTPPPPGQEAVEAFFTPFFAQLERDDFLSHPLVGSSAASLVGAFGAWICQQPQSLNPAASFVLRGLRTSLEGKVRARSGFEGPALRPRRDTAVRSLLICFVRFVNGKGLLWISGSSRMQAVARYESVGE